MRNIAWKLIEIVALQLTSAEREVVLGDLIETRRVHGRDPRSFRAGGASAVAIVEGLASLASRSRIGAPMQLHADGILVCYQLGASKSARRRMASELPFD